MIRLWYSDQTSQPQALERTALDCLSTRDTPAPDHDRYRHGTLTLFAAQDYLSGKVFAHSAPAIAIASGLPSCARPISDRSEPCIIFARTIPPTTTPKSADGFKRPFSYPFPFHLFLLAHLVERFFGEITAKVIPPGAPFAASRP